MSGAVSGAERVMTERQRRELCAELAARWPHIRTWLRVEPSGWVEDEYFRWHFATERVSVPCGELAAANEEWADFWEFRLEQRADELAGDDGKRGLVAEWTDDMAYVCRRCAAFARGEDPGEPVPLSVRRPDLYAAKQARVAEIIARLDQHGDYRRDGDRQLVGAGVAR